MATYKKTEEKILLVIKYVQSKYTPCVKCGFYHPSAMDWHHIDESTKKRGVSELSRTGQSIKQSRKLMGAYAFVLCHRIMHGEFNSVVEWHFT